MIILQEAINTFSFSPHIDKESPADKPVTCLRGFFLRRAPKPSPSGSCRQLRVYLKTHDVTGSEGFLRCARHFFAGILTYFKEK